MQAQVKEQCLSHTDVSRCIDGIYHVLSKDFHGNTGNIVIQIEDFCNNDHTIIVTIMMVQSRWEHLLRCQWREEEDKIV